MDLSIQSGFWLVNSVALVVAFVLDQLPAVPNVWRSIFRWGKMRVGVITQGKQFYEVPKRWFQHFYPIGIVTNTVLLISLAGKVFFDQPWPPLLSSVLHLYQYPARYTELIRAEPVLLVLAMELFQVCRRCYETFYVHIFSEKATMTLLHYLLGSIYYLSIGTCALAGLDFHNLQFAGSISVTEGVAFAVGLGMFVSASVMQHKSFKILAALRTDAKGKAKQEGYIIPRGGWFDIISCPHFLAEIVIYLSFCVIFQFKHTVMLSLFCFVLVNQTIAALLTYQWYCRNFPEYGAKRYAIFPYIL